MIRVVQLRKSYGDVRAVDDVSFEIDRGEVVGFLGPNGAGKSTTMKMITGFLRPDGGSIEVAGHSLEDAPMAARGALGYLPETTPLYRSMRVDEYLDWAARVRRIPRARRAAAIGLARERCDLVGWGRRRIAELSKGYRQRVGLAQALVADPAVLVLDEPTSGLDPTEIVRIRDLVAELGRERTVLISTHVLAEVQETAERVLILAGGRVVADGHPRELADAEPTHVLVTLGSSDSAVEVCARVAQLAHVQGVRALAPPASGRHALALDSSDHEACAVAIARLCAESGWDLYELRPERPTLEDVFLSRTSAVARSGGKSL